MSQRVLFIEDELIYAEFVKALLQDALEFVQVATLAEGLAWLRTDRRFDAVIIDLNLKDSQGEATFDAVHAECAGMPVVVLSGVEEVLLKKLAHKGAACAISKGNHPASDTRRQILFALRRAMCRAALDRALMFAEENVQRCCHAL